MQATRNYQVSKAIMPEAKLTMKKTKPHQLSAFTGMLIVMANMIGTGVFTSLGLQIETLQNTGVLITLWITGGLAALAGAFSYAEIATMVRQSGGEYVFLSKVYHPLAGYLAGWVSLTVGFAAPIALSAIALFQYLPVNIPYAKYAGILLIVVITYIHTMNLKVSSRFQSYATLVKLLFIAGLIALGFILPGGTHNAIGEGRGYFTELGSFAFAVGLVYVAYAYSGWNATIYIVEEFSNPRRAIPFSLIGGTLVVTGLYVLLQYVFLKHIPLPELIGELNVGTLAVKNMLGTTAAKWFGLGISLLLLSGTSAMIWIGPRVTSRMARDHPLWRNFLSDTTIPKKALWLQAAISSLMICTGTFEEILIYCGVLLNLVSMLAVAGVLIGRRKKIADGPVIYRSPFYPVPQLLFILLSLWMIFFTIFNRPFEALFGLINLLAGLVTYIVSRRM